MWGKKDGGGLTESLSCERGSLAEGLEPSTGDVAEEAVLYFVGMYEDYERSVNQGRWAGVSRRCSERQDDNRRPRLDRPVVVVSGGCGSVWVEE